MLADDWTSTLCLAAYAEITNGRHASTTDPEEAFTIARGYLEVRCRRDPQNDPDGRND
jgi:hypothetical protein